MPPKTPRSSEDWMTMAHIGSRLRAVRELRGASQSDMARMLQTDQSKWSKLESGQRLPDPLDMLQVCKLLQTTMDFLYMGIANSDETRQLLKAAKRNLVIPVKRGRPEGQEAAHV
jgi:transcriptional regulator with XRE-family HTH domain